MPSRLERAFQGINEEAADEILRADAESLGVPWFEYCYRLGMVGAAQERRIRRHEVQYDVDTVLPEEATTKRKQDDNE